MRTVTLTIGHNVHGVPTYKSLEVIETVATYYKLEGLTAYEVTGLWCGEYETSTRLEVAGLSEEAAADMVNKLPALCTLLKQDAIMYQLTDSAQFAEAVTATAEQTA